MGSHPAKQWTSSRPAAPSEIEQDGDLSSWQGHLISHPEPVRWPFSALAIAAALMESPC
jgi:hypothetical protein